MKRLLSLAVLMLVVMAFVTVSYARHRERIHKTTGEVVSVDSKTNTVVIKYKSRRRVRELVLTSDNKTKITDNKTLSYLKPGDKVTAKYVRQGYKNKVLEYIIIGPPRKK